ncbi:hypothetical protein Pmar_PMAR002144 [Perkinsus marinus ATCC 50983]|uniref:Uncharacterized protein n=1 Tax=Perkinsus marinus (strain ATCC 50983 / TXsc) TaxID=423536 RepID=C5KP88_PERM5|nr:hypothetical protein Pmar_PMAR002144 [Perkinsus marinus ATCC 50983]EER13695.1 hypothetical protein Pmar_PMAR002144 [Perkinsus marinus ATCC 50983]|eukprot:XP_002781900.1 hypothetical protein Pmar_PMAR002144 [Perkinsus marinus ATCC 50983]
MALMSSEVGTSGATLLPQNKVPSLKECLVDILEDCIVGVYHNARTPDVAQNIYLSICWWRDSQAFGEETPLIEAAIHTMNALRKCAPSAALVSDSCALESAIDLVLSDGSMAGVPPVAELRKADSDMDSLMTALETFVRSGSTPEQIVEGMNAEQLEKLCRAHMSITELLVALDARHKALMDKCRALNLEINFVDKFLQMKVEDVSSPSNSEGTTADS